MRKRILTISCCDDCCYFDNHYYGYNEICRMLNRKIEKIGGEYPIPEDCPLPKDEN